jgi:nitrilase
VGSPAPRSSASGTAKQVEGMTRETQSNLVRAAAVQAESAVLDVEAGTEKACRLIAEAAGLGARLIVFPESFIPVYPNGSLWGRGLSRFGAPEAKRAFARMHRNSVQVPGPVTDRIARAAREAQALVVIGVSEREAQRDTLFNTLVFLGPDGTLLGKHRKLVPTNHERLIWGMGDGSTLGVFETPVGRVGGLICWENWMPLARFALYAQGEQIHLAPAADDREVFLVNARNTAAEGRVFVVCVNTYLRKSRYPADFELQEDLAPLPEELGTGGSAIIGPDGEFLAGPLWNQEGILIADLDLDRITEERQLLDVTGHFARPDVLSLRFNRSPLRSLEEDSKDSSSES